ncbi:acetate--CoA ligase family protein [Hydrogenophaga sp.]|uniref:acetate--CoA ligase family protein n=1 Tax=Hydrogenophaga sp. TaxID=1904254 RepID=UPI002727F42D|nr:acetate--CoA ligase family protein [Hydrogenophaga sp.]MDO9435980.1 acetate--CoA ligase family protein [Hydrogenophaga sp.]
MRHSLEVMFEPTAVVVIGGSSEPDKLGGRPIHYTRSAGFEGDLMVVNARAKEPVQGLPTFKSVDDIDRPVDHAIIVVPAPHVAEALEACGRKGIKAVQVLTSGFAEVSEDGIAEQGRLLEIARRHGMRMLGPNCLGIVGVHNRFHATFATVLAAFLPTPGGLGIVTQSGAFGACAYTMAIQRGIGLSRIVATGNEADIDVAECIDFMAQDPRTRVICAAIESCRDGDRLRRALRAAAAAGKPVVIMKVGVSAIGAAAAATHTGSLAGDDAVFDTVFAECGAWRARTIEEMMDIASLLVIGPLPRNQSAGIVTLSGGLGVLMADVCAHAGLELPPLPAGAAERVKALLPFAAMANPLDMTAQAEPIPNGWQRVVRTMLEHTDWGTVFVYIAAKAAAPARFESSLPVLAEIRRDHPDRCIVLIGPSDTGIRQSLEQMGFVIMDDPSRAVVAAGAAAKLASRRATLNAAHTATATAPRHALPAVLDEASAKGLLGRYGIPLLPEQVCVDAETAVAAATSMGYPVAMKIVSPDILHKTEVGGVALNVRDENALRDAFARMLSRVRSAQPEARISGVLVTPMATGGVEVIMGVQHDPVFGPMMMYGLGGVAVELFKDVTFASAPLTRGSAQVMVDSVRSSALFDGWRGGPRMDKDAVVDALCMLSEFAIDHAQAIAGAEINPFLALPNGGFCLDALIHLKPSTVS